MNKRVAFFLGTMGTGGAERVISIISNEYAKRGWDSDICVLLKNEVAYELHTSTRVIDYTGVGQSRIKRAPYWLKCIRQYVKKNNPDVIVSFAARINVLVMLACIGLKTKIVVSERNDPKSDGRGVPTRILTRLLYPHASCVVFQTERVRSYFGSRIQGNSRVIPNPIDISILAHDTDPTKIVTVGSLKEQKNHKMLIQAFGMLHESHPEMKLYIYGEGYYRPQTEAEIQKLELSKFVLLMGDSQRVHEDISDACFFVLSSDYEGLSNALLEAMCMGLPCISTDCAGSDEYIDDGENGLLTPVGDVVSFQKAMLRFIEDDQLREKCGKNAKKVKDRVGIESALNQWEEVIEG